MSATLVDEEQELLHDTHVTSDVVVLGMVETTGVSSRGVVTIQCLI